MLTKSARHSSSAGKTILNINDFKSISKKGTRNPPIGLKRNRVAGSVVTFNSEQVNSDLCPRR